MTSKWATNTNGTIGKICSKCKLWYLLTEFGKDNSTQDGLKCRCKSCNCRISKLYKRKVSNKIMNELKINGCAICGYNKCNRALSFHHTNPDDKLFIMSAGNIFRNEKSLCNEINKCILLCLNCHMEIECKQDM